MTDNTSMKCSNRPLWTIILSTSLAFSSLFSGLEIKANSIVEVNSGSTDNPVFDMVQADPALKGFYDECANNHSFEKEKIPNCLWDSVKNNPTLKKKVIQAMESVKKSPEKNDAKEIMAKKNQIKIDESNDPYIKKLNDYISSQLENVFTAQSGKTHDEKGKLIDDKKRKTYLATDHAKFSELYNTQLANSVTQALSSYCSEAKEEDDFTITKPANDAKDPNKKNTISLFIIKKDADQRASDLKSNMTSLNTADFSNKDCSDATNAKSPGCQYNRCIMTIHEVCYNTSISSPKDRENDLAESQSRACIVMDFIKNARAGIMALDKQKDFYDDLSKKQAPAIDLTSGGLKEFKSEGDQKRGSQDITTITSGDLQKIADESKGEVDSLKCIDENGNRNEAICKKLVIEDKEKAEKALLEFGMRRIAQVDEIENIKTTEELKTFLISEGDSAEKADEIIKTQLSENNGKIEDVVQKIKDKYKAENDAIIKSLTDKVETHNVDLAKEPDKANQKLQNIQKELQSKGSRYANMLQYGNIVSAYLTVTDASSKVQKTNTAQIFRELASAQGQKGTTNPADPSNANAPIINAETVKKNVESAGLKNEDDNTGQVQLTVEDINKILGK